MNPEAQPPTAFVKVRRVIPKEQYGSEEITVSIPVDPLGVHAYNLSLEEGQEPKTMQDVLDEQIKLARYLAYVNLGLIDDD